MQQASSRTLYRVDHLIFLAKDLTAGCSLIEELTGVRPSPGGRHPVYGTHNALLGLGEKMYLEIMAPDPSSELAAGKSLFHDFLGDAPRLVRWVLRSTEIDAETEAAKLQGFDLGSVQPGQRRQPDGTVLTWRLSDPYCTPRQGLQPFLIDWGQTKHPASQLATECRLVSMRFETAEPESAYHVTNFFGVKAEVKRAPKFRIVAELETPRGRVELS